jgi:hypothetical protein
MDEHGHNAVGVQGEEFGAKLLHALKIDEPACPRHALLRETEADLNAAERIPIVVELQHRPCDFVFDRLSSTAEPLTLNLLIECSVG